MANKNIKWITCDLDGTLLRYENFEHIIEPESIKAIQSLKAKNIVFTIATGRHHKDALKICNDNNLIDTHSRYIIGCNGGVIFDAITNEFISETLMDEERLKISEGILKYLINRNIKTILASYQTNRDVIINPEVEKDQEFLNEFIKYEGNFSNANFSYMNEIYKQKDILKNIFFFEDKLNNYTIEDLREKIINEFKINPNDFIVTSKHSLEYNPSHVSKGNAIKFLANKLNLDLNQTLSIGDSGNDISMFEVTKYSATLASSSDLVKEKATKIFSTKASLVVKEAIDSFTE